MRSLRYEYGSSRLMLESLPKHIKKLNGIVKIQGVRFRSLRGKNTDTPYINSFETIRIYGKDCKISSDGVCWGYNGEGPRALESILKICGVSEGNARLIAFNSHRNDSIGIDWEIYLNDKDEILTFRKEIKNPKVDLTQAKLF